ncbi:MAG: DUF4489 domain-containing protein [Clostridium sp.]|uniref:DUF4489 domain-containing protein n=1 Tax=Clostridium sp. TaxID=1506 RepID=UPI0025BDFB4C|nr:DUF4489 domain-containing protein [Clostridium sp.]MCF0149481.1 DUF4489 domain-containing protein [Clostridium sp.]
MNSLSCGELKDELNHGCTDNNINIEHGYTGSALIPNGAEVGTSYIISSIDVKNINIRLLEFACNIINTNFIGNISFQIFKIFNDNSKAIPVEPPWIVSFPVANTGADIISFFVCDDFCSNKGNYIVKATIISSSFRSLSITDIVGGNDNVTLIGPATFFTGNTVFNIFPGDTFTLNNLNGNINIMGSYGDISRFGNTLIVDNIEEGSFIFTELPGFNNISLINGTLRLTVTPFNGETIEKAVTSGSSVITNGIFAALSS